MANREHTKRINGFTALEVLVTLIIIGIIGVLVISRGNLGQTDLLAQTEVIKAHIRHAQFRAMDSNRRWGMHCDASGRTYWLFVDDGADPITNKRKLPGEEADVVDLGRHGLTLTAFTLFFDDHGRPCTDGNGTQLEKDLTLTLSTDEGAATTILITRNTGFVP